MPSYQRKYVTCPHCGCELREGRLIGHCAKVHGKTPTGSSVISSVRCGPAKKPRTLRKSINVRCAEAELQAYANKLKSTPRKCSVAGCERKVMPPEEFCEPCKQNSLQKSSINGSDSHKSGCRTCGGPTIPGENYCYTCLGD